MTPPSPTNLSGVALQVSQVQDTLKAINEELRKLNDQALDRRVSKLEGTVAWLGRALGGSVIAAIVSALAALVGTN